MAKKIWVSKETNIAYIIITLVSIVPCYVGKVNWWVLFFYPCFYFILWQSLQETKKDRHVRMLKKRLNEMYPTDTSNLSQQGEQC